MEFSLTPKLRLKKSDLGIHAHKMEHYQICAKCICKQNGTGQRNEHTAANTTHHAPMKDHPNNRLADALAAFFRSLSGSSDRELAGAAFKLEDKVLDLVRSDAKPKGKTPRQ